jgi:hypothetical protein
MHLIDIRGELETKTIIILKEAGEQEGSIQEDGNDQDNDDPVSGGYDGSSRPPDAMIEWKGI